MGLLKAAAGALGGNLADQWKEMIYCESLDQDTLVVKGQKRTSNRSSNTKGEQNIISNGSVVVVNNGQCMIIVEQGKVVDICAEPGEFVYDTTVAPSVFTGSLGDSVVDTFKNIGKRFTFGGDTGVDQRVYYLNTKEILGNKYGTANPIPFRVVDANIGLDMDISVRCNGEFSYKIVDPLLFYTNVSGNIEEPYDRIEIQDQLRTELLTALQPAFAKVSAAGVRYSAIPAHTAEIADALNEELSSRWAELRGIKVVSFGVNTIAADPKDEEMIKNLQKGAVMRDPRMAAAVLAGAQAEAMVGAANNTSDGGAFMAFAGMNMAANAGGAQVGNLYQMGQQQPQAANPYGQDPTGGFGQGAPMAAPAAPVPAAAPVAPMPAPASGDSWTCSCGAMNTSKFCHECGSPRPAASPQYRCDKCGWVPSDQSQPPKFCPECGDSFDENDRA